MHVTPFIYLRRASYANRVFQLARFLISLARALRFLLHTVPRGRASHSGGATHNPRRHTGVYLQEITRDAAQR